jgi:RNA polymerase sigma-70 factor (ECF subfamily)
VRITYRRETADELTLDVFHDVWRGAATYDAAGGSVVGWIMNQAIQSD